MGEMEYVTCVICGRKINIDDAEPIFTGRVRYRCFECIDEGIKEVKKRDFVSKKIRKEI